MKRTMGSILHSKFILRTALVLSALLLFMSILVFLVNIWYRDTVISLLKNYLDEELKTEIVIHKSDIRFSLFKHFPKVGIELKNVLVKSSPDMDFRNFNLPYEDTLLFSKKISFVLNLGSFLTNKYQINKIVIDEAQLNLLIDNNGNGNYDILSDAKSTSGNKDTISIDLEKIQLKNIQSRYIDKRIQLNVKGYIPEALLSGTFTDLDYKVDVKAKLDNTDMFIEKINYLSNQQLNVDLKITKLAEMYFFQNGNMNISGIDFLFTGSWNDLKSYYDFSFTCNNAPINKLKQPAIDRYLGKTGLVPSHGTLTAKANLKGYSGEIPHVKTDFILANGKFRNIKNDLAFKEVFVKGSYTNGIGSSSSSSYLKIDSLSTLSNHSRINAAFTASNFIHPLLKGHIIGEIDLSDLEIFENIRSKYELEGNVATTMSFNGQLPAFSFDNIGDLNNLGISGNLYLKDVNINSVNQVFPKFNASGDINFSNLNTILLKNIQLQLGSSDLNINGELSHLPQLQESSIDFPIYKLKIRSRELHLEDFISKNTIENKSESKFNLPDSLFVYAGIDCQKFYYEKFEAENLLGELSYAPKILTVTGFGMKTIRGKLYSNFTLQEQQGKLITHCDVTFQHLDIEGLFYSFNNFGQTIIDKENLKGFLSGKANVVTGWDASFNPILNDITMESDITIGEGKLINYEPLLGLSKFVEIDELKKISFDELNCHIQIQNSIVYLSQTDIRSSAMNLTGSGEHRFDNSYDYHFQIELSEVLWNKARNKKPENTEFGYIVDDGSTHTILPLGIKGKDTDYDVYYDLKTAKQNAKQKLKQEKQELRNLFKPSNSDNNDVNPHKSGTTVIWEDDQEVKTDEVIPTPDGKKETKNTKSQEDVQIQWNDE